MGVFVVTNALFKGLTIVARPYKTAGDRSPVLPRTGSETRVFLKKPVKEVEDMLFPALNAVRSLLSPVVNPAQEAPQPAMQVLKLSRRLATAGICRAAALAIVLAGFAVVSAAAAGPVAASESGSMPGQTPNVIKQVLDPAQTQTLKGHVPGWANPENLIGSVPPDLAMNQVTLVLARSAQNEQAFDALLAEQQDPNSPQFHHWLTPAEIGDQFGLSQQDIDTLSGWLESQGLKVSWVSPSRIFIGIAGTAGDLARAFQTDFMYYNVDGEQLFAAASEPVVPRALAPAIKAIRGLHSPVERPQHSAHAERIISPQYTSGSGAHYVAPGDFAKIYDLPSNLTGAGFTIGIVGESRIDAADITNFNNFLGAGVPAPTEIIPTAYGGKDPGAATTTNTGSYPAAQGEATLDVQRAGSVATGAKILLVVSSQAGGGIDPPTQYLVNKTPLPAQVIDISWGACESQNASSVTFWDTLFKQAAGEGISIFVSAGDSGAAGCDTHNASPPASPLAISPNYICSSTYATCVGGTEFNDASNPSTYWGTGHVSALSYIPEGAWNEPMNSSSQTQIAGTGGGVSKVIATPSWQTGTGVPSARTGRYTPDIAFTAAGHDGYFGCFIAGGGNCVNSLEVFSGTSASAPDMAGIAALLDQKKGAAQGNLNPALYGMAATTPSAFHDVTVTTSGVSSCTLSTPSLCNNSDPGPSGLSGGEAGYMVGTGFDLATGWGSLDVSVFINNFSSTGPPTPPAVPTLSSPANGATVSTTSTTLSWAASSGATSYSVQAYTVSCGGTAVTVGSPGASTSISLAGLTSGKTYYWRVSATGTGGTSAYSSCNNFTVKIPPAVPTLSSPANASTVSTTSTTLKWNAVTGATSYSIQAYTVSCGGTAVTVGSPGASTSVSLTGLITGKTYYWRVSATGTGGTSAYSGCFNFITKIPPATPSLTSPTNAAFVTTSSATLKWSAVTGATSYNVQAYTVSCGGTAVTVGSPGANTSLAISGLTTGKTYYWRVQAVGSGGSSPYSSCSNFIAKIPPAVPTLTTPTNAASLAAGTTSTSLKWNAVTGATSYAVQAYTGSCGGTAVTVGSPGATTSVTLSGLSNGKTYYWRANATGSGGSSAYSSCFTFSVL